MAADPSYDPTEFQTVLLDWMRRNALSQMAAAQRIGISQGIINRWLKPRGDLYLVQPEIAALEKLASVRGIGVDIMQLKRMTNRLSPSDLSVLNKLSPNGPPDPRLEGLISDVRTGWPSLRDDEEREHVAAIVRVAIRLHHARTRKPRERRSKEEDDGKSGSALLMVA